MQDKGLWSELVMLIGDLLDRYLSGQEIEGCTAAELLFIAHLFDYLGNDHRTTTRHPMSYGFAVILDQIQSDLFDPKSESTREIRALRDRAEIQLRKVEQQRKSFQTDEAAARSKEFVFHQNAKFDKRLVSIRGVIDSLSDAMPVAPGQYGFLVDSEGKIDTYPIRVATNRIQKVAMALLEFEAYNSTIIRGNSQGIWVLSLCLECNSVICSQRSNSAATCSNRCRMRQSRKWGKWEGGDTNKDLWIALDKAETQELFRQLCVRLAEGHRDLALKKLSRMPGADFLTKKGTISPSRIRDADDVRISIWRKDEGGVHALMPDIFGNYEMQQAEHSIRLRFSEGGIDQSKSNLHNQKSSEVDAIVSSLYSLLREAPKLYLGEVGNQLRADLKRLAPDHPMVFPLDDDPVFLESRRHLSATSPPYNFDYSLHSKNTLEFKYSGPENKTYKFDITKLMKKAMRIISKSRKEAKGSPPASATSEVSIGKPGIEILSDDLTAELDLLPPNSTEWLDLVAAAIKDGRATLIRRPPISFTVEEWMSREMEADLAAITAECKEVEEFIQRNKERYKWAFIASAVALHAQSKSK